jgi:hypothetical protein
MKGFPAIFRIESVFSADWLFATVLSTVLPSLPLRCHRLFGAAGRRQFATALDGSV